MVRAIVGGRADVEGLVGRREADAARAASAPLLGLRLRHHDDLLDAAAVDIALEPVDRVARRGPERGDGVLAGHGHRLPILEDRRRGADLAHGVDQAADDLEGCLTAAEHEGGRVESPHRADDPLGGKIEGQQQRAEAGAAEPELQRLDLERLEVETLARVEYQDALRTARRGHDPPRRVQPAGRPATGQLVLGLATVAAVSQLDRRQQHLLDAALHRAHREALLHQPVRRALVEVVEGVEEPERRAWSLAALTRYLDRRGDVVGLLERAPQGLELREVVLAMTPLGAPRLGVAEAPLPAAQGVRADAE